MKNPTITENFRGIPTEGYDGYHAVFPEYFQNGFVYGSHMRFDGKDYICINLEKLNDTCLKNGCVTMVEVKSESIGRNAFILDKDGNSIFEGDIYERKHKELSMFPSTAMAVVWDTDRAAFGFADIDNPQNINFISDYLTNQYMIKQVGDIHRNLEEFMESE